MDKSKMPVAPKNALIGVRSDMTDKAFKAWNPDINAAAVSAENTISVLDPIGADWYGEGVTAKRIAGALRSIGDKDVIVNINSPGGDFFEGLAIYNLLREHSGSVTVNILGMAASAASVIAMAGDEVKIAKASFLMIHNTWVMAAGDQHAFREVADWLKPFDEALVDIYQTRTGSDAKALAAMLDKETWLSGSDAIEQGFADSDLASDAVAGQPKSAGNMSAVSAKRKIDLLLAKASYTRTERGALVAALKGGTQDAVPNGMPSAAIASQLSSLAERLKTL